MIWVCAAAGLQLLAGCVGVESTPQRPDRSPWQSETPQVAVRTLVPAPTDTTAAAYPVDLEPTVTAQLPAYPAAKSEYPLLGMTAAALRDCALTPGLAGCGGQGQALTGRLAITDQSIPRVAVLDLGGGKAWQVPFHPESMQWSPAGSMLLLRHDTEGGPQHQLWNAAGERLADPPGDALLRWQRPAKLLAQDTLVTSDGYEFRLELAAGPRWVLHALSASEGRVLTIDERPADRQYLLLDRAPGDGRLLAQTYFPTNLGLASGGELILIDPKDGKVQPLGISAPLGSTASLEWSPAQPGLLAFLSSGAEPGMTTLALLDFSTLALRQPLPQGIQISSLAWRPDGEQLAFAAEPLPGVITAAEQDNYPATGIYLLDPAGGSVENPVQFPTGAGEGWVRWTADTKVLLYAVVLRDAQGSASIEVHAYGTADQSDTLLVSPIPLAAGARARIDWQSIIAYSP